MKGMTMVKHFTPDGSLVLQVTADAGAVLKLGLVSHEIKRQMPDAGEDPNDEFLVLISALRTTMMIEARGMHWFFDDLREDQQGGG